MDKKEKIDVVKKAYDEVREEIGPRAFKMLSINQRLLLTQDKLPTKPLYSTAKIKDIVFGKDEG